MLRASRATPRVNVRGTRLKYPTPGSPCLLGMADAVLLTFFRHCFACWKSQKVIDVEECSVTFLRSSLLSRAEEVATLNLATNAGIIAGVVLFAVSTVFTVDLVSVYCSSTNSSSNNSFVVRIYRYTAVVAEKTPQLFVETHFCKLRVMYILRSRIHSVSGLSWACRRWRCRKIFSLDRED